MQVAPLPVRLSSSAACAISELSELQDVLPEPFEYFHFASIDPLTEFAPHFRVLSHTSMLPLAFNELDVSKVLIGLIYANFSGHYLHT
jgi:hypothetical protein